MDYLMAAVLAVIASLPFWAAAAVIVSTYSN